MNFKKTSVNAFSSNPAGNLVFYLEDGQGEQAELIIKAHDVPRLMYAAIDALQKKANTR